MKTTYPSNYGSQVPAMLDLSMNPNANTGLDELGSVVGHEAAVEEPWVGVHLHDEGHVPLPPLPRQPTLNVHQPGRHPMRYLLE